MGGELFIAIFTGIALPVGMLVLKRHHTANPNAWEEIFAFWLHGELSPGLSRGPELESVAYSEELADRT
jgi:hypothetical protein